MKKLIIFFSIVLFISSCSKPQTLVGGRCEGCEAVFEYGDKNLSSTDTLPGFNEGGSRLKVSGTIFKNDGKTPAEDVILYVYHTDTSGVYPKKGDEEGWGQRHGFIREWLKTDMNGHYTFYTIKPGSYPNSRNPAHIHITILEPDGKYYWIHDYLFADDPFLTDRELSTQNSRGGSGVLTLKKEDGMMLGERYIVLGKNVPGY
jgi:protocatechuate 3,4-dioxygenase, beta subunit